MTKTLPSFLRVHHEAASSQRSDSRQLDAKDSVNDFWHAYNEVTGWRIDAADPTISSKLRVSLQPHESAEVADPAASTTPAVSPAVDKLSAQRLADSAARLADQLSEAHETIRLQNAELAARAAIIPDASQKRLADEFAETLADAAVASGCDAVAFYMLDDDTQYLKTRGVHGLPATRLTEGVRELQGSRGDLEAMVRGIVAIDDLNELSVDTWCCPENASSAICAAINHAGVPIGTLWFFYNETQVHDEARQAVAKMTANQIALQVQNAAATPSSSAKKSAGDLDAMANWQFAGLPMGTQLAPDWRVDGMIESPQAFATGWHAWDVLPDGTMMIAIAEAEDKTVAGSMTAAIARSALESHAGYRHTPRQLLQRVSDTLWQTNTMDQLTSLMYVRIDPETGEGEIASAGNLIAMIASRYGYRPAVEQNHSPLASQIDLNCSASTFRLGAGEVLMAYGQGFGADGVDQLAIGNRLRESMQNKELCPLASIRRFLADKPMNHERGAVTILRQ